MRQFVIITRPVEDYADTANLVRHAGFTPLSAPALEIGDTPVELPNPSPYQAVLFSSAHGVRAVSRRRVNPAYFALPVIAVGDHTAAAAREAGFRDVRSAAGTMAEACALIIETLAPPAAILHLRGRDVREDPVSFLKPEDEWEIDGIPLYCAEPVRDLPRDVGEALRAGAVAGVMFYSARSAAAFMDAVMRDNPGACFGRTKALCLAGPVVDSLYKYPLPWGGILVSASPDRHGMAALLDTMRDNAEHDRT